MTVAESDRSVSKAEHQDVICKADRPRGVVLTYGTFDLFHVGHLDLLERLSRLGDRLIVGVSTEEFNKRKGKTTIIPFAQRARIVQALGCVDKVIPEEAWEQKRNDIMRYDVSVFGIGSDWEGRFDDLHDLCKVTYVSRTDGISTTELKENLSVLDKNHINDLKKALDLISTIVSRLD